jgi:RHS repeat-associated protein
LDNTGAVTERVLWGPGVDQVLAEEDSSGVVTWVLTDNQNTVRDLAQYTPGSGSTGTTTIVDHRVYTAFGQPVSTPAVDFTFGYTGRYFDAATGLQWNMNRWYNPRMQRWMGEDPTGLKPDSDPYRYCANGATNKADPNGLDFNTWCGGIYHSQPPGPVGPARLQELSDDVVILTDAYAEAGGGFGDSWQEWLKWVGGKTIYPGVFSNEELLYILEGYVAVTGRKIKHLTVSGHGYGGGVQYQGSAGDAGFHTYTLTEAQIERLRLVLAPDADVYVSACQSARGGAGKELQILANRLRRVVIGNRYSSHGPWHDVDLALPFDWLTEFAHLLLLESVTTNAFYPSASQEQINAAIDGMYQPPSGLRSREW